MSFFLRPLLQKIFKLREKQDSEAVKPFLEHLEDLRWMLVKMVATLGVTMVLSFGFRAQLMHVIQSPLNVITRPAAVHVQNAGAEQAIEEGKTFVKLRSLRPGDSVNISLSLAFYAGFILSFPIQLYFLAGFVLPALTTKERALVLPGVGVGFGLFLLGVYFCFKFVLPLTLRWLYHDSLNMGFEPDWTIADYISFATQMILIVGLSFELPVVVIALVQLGLLTAATLRSTRAYAVVGILLMSAFLAPSTDPITMMIVAAPMLILYELCIWIAWALERREQRRQMRPTRA